MFREAAALGVLQVHLSGGSRARRDLTRSPRRPTKPGSTPISSPRRSASPTRRWLLAADGLDHVQISIQDSEAASADHIAGYDGAFARKRALAAEVVRLRLPLTVNAVMHRANIDRIGEMVDLALALGASRVEIAHVQYYGWALKNRAALMPTREQVERAAAAVDERLRRQHPAASSSTPWCRTITALSQALRRAAGAGARSTSRQPAKVLPCHAAESITGLEFWNVREHSLADIWMRTRRPSTRSAAPRG